MQKLSGLILDVYDDLHGAVLQEVFPTRDHIPEVIKSAHYLSEEERRSLPSSVFALELVDHGSTLRKYACIDPGNTAISVEYFARRGGLLPVEAQKTAAANLLTACGWYRIPPPEFLKEASRASQWSNLALDTAKVTGRAGLGAVKAVKAAPGLALNAAFVPLALKGSIAPRMRIAKASGGVINPNVVGRVGIR